MASGMDAMTIVLGKPEREHSMQQGGIVRKQKEKTKSRQIQRLNSVTTHVSGNRRKSMNEEDITLLFVNRITDLSIDR